MVLKVELDFFFLRMEVGGWQRSTGISPAWSYPISLGTQVFQFTCQYNKYFLLRDVQQNS